MLYLPLAHAVHATVPEAQISSLSVARPGELTSTPYSRLHVLEVGSLPAGHVDAWQLSMLTHVSH